MSIRKLVTILYLFSLLAQVDEKILVIRCEWFPMQIISSQNNCARLCNENIDWDKFQQFCTLDINNSTDPYVRPFRRFLLTMTRNLYTTYTNFYCPSGITISSCISNVDLLEVVYPGSCGKISHQIIRI